MKIDVLLMKPEGHRPMRCEDIMENNYMFVMLWNLSVISHWIFPKCSFFISGAKFKNNSRDYVAL